MSSGFEQTKEELQRTVREVLRVLLYRRWSFLIPFCAGASAIFIFSHRLPREYKAHTTFERRNPIPISRVLERSGPVSMDNMHDLLMYDIMGEEALINVADTLGLTDALPRQEDGTFSVSAQRSRKSMAKRLRRMLDYVPLKTSPELDRIMITARGNDPELVVNLVNHVRENYFESSRQRFLDRLAEARDFYLTEIESVTESIDLHEKMLEALEGEYPYVNQETTRIAATRAAALERSSAQLQAKIEEHRRKISRLESQLEAMPVPKLLVDGAPSYNTDFLDTEADLQRERRRLMQYIMNIENEMTLKKLEQGMLDRHPEMQKLLTKKAQASADLVALNHKLGLDKPAEEAGAFSKDPAVVEIKRSERQRLTIELADTRAALAVAEEQLKAAQNGLGEHHKLRQASSEKRVEYRQMRRSLDDEKRTVESLRSDERKLARILDIDAKDQGMEFIVIEEAGTSRRPVSPNARSVLLLAFGAGLAMGACVVFLREFFDHTFHTANSVSLSLGVTVLEGIDEILLPIDRQRALIKRLTMVPVAVLFLGLLVVSGGLAYLSLEYPQQFKQVVEKATATWQDINLLG